MRLKNLARSKTFRSPHVASLALISATMAWGASFFLVKKATAQVGIWPFMFWRFALSAAVMGIFFPQKVVSSRKTTIYRGSILGILLFMAIFAQTVGLQQTLAGKSGFLTSLYVPLVPLLGWIVWKQKVTYRHFALAAIAVFGLYLLTHGDGSNWWEDLANPGYLWTLSTAFIYAFHILFTERFTREEPDSLALGLWQIFVCFGLVVLGILFESGGRPFLPIKWTILSWPSFAIASAIFNAVFTTCFGFVMQIICQKTLGSLKAALIFALEAPFAVFFAYLFAGERLSGQEFVGALVVFLVSIVPEPWISRRR